jgi:hypothetical protein
MPFRPERKRSRPDPGCRGGRRSAASRCGAFFCCPQRRQWSKHFCGAWICLEYTDLMGQGNTAVFSLMGVSAALDTIGCRGPDR